MRKTSTYARKRRATSAWDRERHKHVNPVKEALIVAGIREDVERLRTGASLHAYTGANAQALANLAGRLVYVTCHAARLHGLGETPEARILAGTANALADLAQDPKSIEAQRGAIVSGLAAIDRLMPSLHPLSMAAGALELDQLLAQPVAWMVYLPSIDTQHLYYSQEDLGYVDDVTNHADAEVTPLYTARIEPNRTR